MKKILGLMSGTSLDGIDMALLETDGATHIEYGAVASVAYTAQMRGVLRQTLDEARALSPAELAVQDFSTAEALITDAHISAVQDFCAEHGKPDLLGFHGQTIAHAPKDNITIQLGDAARLAKTCAIDVVADFRKDDVAAGGEGAPLAPLFHAALIDEGVDKNNLTLPVIVVNIGGVANLTFYDGENIVAFDTGTGNALLDDWIASHTSEIYDKDGATAAQGTADMAQVAQWLENAYFAKPYPKSLDRLNFTHNLSSSLKDGAATLTAFTAQAIALGIKQCPRAPEAVILCGGGRHNQTLVKMLAEALGFAPTLCEAINWNGDALEAQAFAWLAMRTIRGLPISLPSTTGVAAPQTGGRLFRCRS
ncbi:MAG: anhydro-N-acetylmuramic acid kinase [Alphaproteobacteria bacterium]|nr:anhydro-N-acetylmuramic acid kinase [Alphaproteobacteria bacterium]MBE8220780.1 anhydro-N-acetylmuramic acid kinase [Alphaproteobacteria bacterium]